MKKSITTFAYVIFHDQSSANEILVVKRSPNDRYFPNMWGLPAGTLQKRESYEEAIQQTAKRNLNIEVEILGERNSGSSDRGTHVIDMRLYEARIISGVPQVRDVNSAGYGYTEVRWASPEILDATREQGSLCCQLVHEWFQTAN